MKKIIEILQLAGYSLSDLIKLIALGIIGGLSSFFFIALVNYAIQMMIAGKMGEERNWFIIYFLIVIVFYSISRRILSISVTRLSQNIYWSIRKQIIIMTLGASYKKINNMRNDINAALTTDVDLITGASFKIVDLMISVILILSCIVYMLYLSAVLSGITIAVISIGIIIYRINSYKFDKLFVRTRELEISFLYYFNALLSGSKEINIEPVKGDEINKIRILEIAKEADSNNIKAFKGYLNNEMVGQVLLYVLISSIILFSGIIVDIKSDVIISFVLVLLYVLSPLEGIMIMLPSLSKAVVSASKILQLKSDLQNADSTKQQDVNHFSSAFHQINVSQLIYTHKGANGDFALGPLNLSLNKGEICFIYGGNGSGKTTFLYSLLGLNIMDSGTIHVDNTVVVPENISGYKKLFSTVFSDFYLFDALYGLKNIDEKQIQYYLELFEIEKKVTVANGKFSTLDLSTGQKKRLALIAALMEQKPILVMDEWAADQDPYFRKKFYTTILPVLKKSGLTIIAITHDDHYYHCADRLFKMDSGTLTEELIHRKTTEKEVIQLK